jgi:glutathionyl-hydroquinone reductase
LLGYKYTPGVKPTGFSFAYLIDKTAPERSTTFEAFMAGVIKDKPANIDTFYDSNVKPLFDAVVHLRAYCQSIAILADDNTTIEDITRIKVTHSNAGYDRIIESHFYCRLREILQLVA